MAYLPIDDSNVANETQNNYRKLNLLGEKDDSMITTMNELITTMQKLQQLFIKQMTNDQYIVENKIDKNINAEKFAPSQTEILLQQVQNAMHSTIAQLSNRNAANIPTIPTNTDIPLDNDKQLSISEKWRLYTEMYQSKSECSKDYCVNKMKLGQELGLSFKETKREMLIGLWSNRLSIVLYLKEHETEDDLMKDIDEWERIESARNEVFKKYRNKNYKNN